MILGILKNIKTKLSIRKRKAQWRIQNPHNETLWGTGDDFNHIKVGKGSYGIINVQSFRNESERLEIGNYVSIGQEVIFILGGNHQTKTFTTYPIKAKTIEPFSQDDAQTKGAIIIEDEVWIGTHSVILSGVRIGKGSIIAAGSVVTKNVTPFSIVAGNPARFIKYRIEEELIKKRSEVDLINIPKEKIVNNIDLFYNELSLENLEKIITLQEK